DRAALLRFREAHRIAGNDLGTFQAFEPALHCRARPPDAAGQGGDRRASVLPQQRNQLLIDGIERLWAPLHAKTDGCTTKRRWEPTNRRNIAGCSALWQYRLALALPTMAS